MNMVDFWGLLGGVASKIADAAKGLLDRLSSLLRRRKNKPSDQELTQVLDDFEAPYLEIIAEAESQITGVDVTPAHVRKRLVGDVVLSKRLYHHRKQTQKRVRRILKAHAKYGMDARKLAMDLFEGYGFRRKEILNPKVALPKYMQDALLERDVNGLLARIQAAQLKTPGLRAGYLQMLDAILEGQGQEAIERAMRTAVYERYRHFANRIAQTELARIQMDRQARELMADDNIQVIQYCLSQTHPKDDICDLYANQNAYGLGPGLYPKAMAPKPPMHPFCRCYLRPRLDLDAERVIENAKAAADYLAGLDARTAARVAGSAAKRDAVMGGAGFDDVVNSGRPEPYRIGHVGDVAE